MRQNRVHLMPPMSNSYARICVKATPSSNTARRGHCDRQRKSNVFVFLSDYARTHLQKIPIV